MFDEIKCCNKVKEVVWVWDLRNAKISFFDLNGSPTMGCSYGIDSKQLIGKKRILGIVSATQIKGFHDELLGLLAIVVS